MNRLLLTAAAVSALAIAAPSAVQSQTSAAGAVGFDQRIGQLETRIEAGIRAGTVTRADARRLRREIRALRNLEFQYRAGGLTREERADLQQRIRTLRQDIRTADRGSYDRYERRADWAEYDGYATAGLSVEQRLDQLEARIDAGVESGAIGSREARRLRRQLDEIDALDGTYAAGGLNAEEQADLRQRLRALRREIRLADRGAYDRNERGTDWAEYDGDVDDFEGRGGPYEGDGWVVAADSPPRPGIAGLFESLLGRGTLRVGQRVSGNLYAVPYDYRNQFRDNDEVYFRSDGSRIYEIDADTHTVARIYVRAE